MESSGRTSRLGLWPALSLSSWVTLAALAGGHVAQPTIYLPLLVGILGFVQYLRGKIGSDSPQAVIRQRNGFGYVVGSPPEVKAHRETASLTSN